MITTWLPSGKQRTRRFAGPSLLLWVAIVLFGLFASHGISPEGAQGHTAVSSATASAHVATPTTGADGTEQPNTGETVDAPDEHDDHFSHPPESCVSGQHQHESPLAAPCFTPALWDFAPDYAEAKPITADSGADALPWPGTRDPVIQQV